MTARTYSSPVIGTGQFINGRPDAFRSPIQAVSGTRCQLVRDGLRFVVTVEADEDTHATIAALPGVEEIE